MKLYAKDGSSYHELEAKPLEDEDELQRLFEENPNLVPWAMDARRVLAREFPTAAGPIDHVGVDALGQIVVIETKLARNTTRRQVLAQIVDYASQLTKFGSQEFVDRVRERVGRDFTEDWFHTRGDREKFQRSVEGNLRQGRLTLIIVMDEADPLIQDAVRFLNRATAFNCILAEVNVGLLGGREVVYVETYGEESADEKTQYGGGAATNALPSMDEAAFVEVKDQQGYGEEARAFVKALQHAGNLGAEVRWTKRGVNFGTGNNSVAWSVNQPYLQVWAESKVLDPVRQFLAAAAAPWDRRIEVYRKTKEGSSIGLVAKIDVRGATVGEFEHLVEFYLKGPRA